MTIDVYKRDISIPGCMYYSPLPPVWIYVHNVSFYNIRRNFSLLKS